MTAAGIRQVRIGLIDANPEQHRKHFDPESLRELGASIKRRGVLQNLVVRKHPKNRGRFEIIAGERRFRAAKLVGMKTLPCRVIAASDAEAFRLSLVENVQRADISALEEADGYATLREKFNMSAGAIAAAVGKSEQYVNHKLQLTRLGPTVRRLIASGTLSALHGYFIARLECQEQQARVATVAAQRELSQHEVNRMVNVLLAGGEPAAPRQDSMFDVDALTPKEQERRNEFQRTLERVTSMLWASWDESLQQINEKVLRGAVEDDLGKVRNLRKWLGDVERALDIELQRRNLAEV